MSLQDQVLKKFESMGGKKTLKEMAGMTGLSLTRVFRLQNGSRMKLDEYEIIKKLIGERDCSTRLIKLIEEAQLSLSPETLEEFAKKLELKVRLSQFQIEEKK
ncbi:MAG: hypothetical protein HN509_15700 [Halobacteriovoraceae bacterium]|nr:hypothetical protein [Halobacteriovoraceae bacterium]MBT5094490.1 hypothetical protein [Halobacteriovoraceae bacterium]